MSDNLSRVKSGSGVKFQVLIDNIGVDFRLVLIAKKGWGSNKFDQYEYGWIDENEDKYIKSVYSGGSTGFCISDFGNPYDKINVDWKKLFKIITYDIEEMNVIAGKEENKHKKERLDFDKTMVSKVNTINKLPKFFKTKSDIMDTVCRFVRTKAVYNPRQSSRIMGGSIFLELKEDSKVWNRCCTLRLDSYKTSDNKLLVKKFANEAKYFFGEIMNRFDSKVMLSMLTNREREIKQIIKEAK